MTKKAPVLRDAPSDTPAPGASRDSSVVETVYIADAQRREILGYLSGRSSAALTDVAAHLAARQSQTDPEEITSIQRERMQRHLLDTQITRLRACGLITFDETTNTVSLTDCGETVVNC